MTFLWQGNPGVSLTDCHFNRGCTQKVSTWLALLLAFRKTQNEHSQRQAPPWTLKENRPEPHWQEFAGTSRRNCWLEGVSATGNRDCVMQRGSQAPQNRKCVAVSLPSACSQWSSSPSGTPDLISEGKGSRAEQQPREHYCSGFPFACCYHSFLPALFRGGNHASSVASCRDRAGNSLQALITWKLLYWLLRDM